MYMGFNVSNYYSCQIVIELSVFSTGFRKKKYQISLKYVQREPSFSMWTDGQTDRHEANSRCSKIFRTRVATVYRYRSYYEPTPGNSLYIESYRVYRMNSHRITSERFLGFDIVIMQVVARKECPLLWSTH
jgi:hypothetical protein